MIGERIKQARLARGLSLRSLASNAGVTAQAISNYETGKDNPSWRVMQAMAKALDVRTEYFHRTQEIDLGEPAYRKDVTLTPSQIQVLEHQTIERLERYLDVESAFGPNAFVTYEHPVRPAEPISCVQEAEERASALREEWHLGDGPIENLTGLLEDRGVKVMLVKTEESFDGCAYRNVPLIVVNSVKPGDRMRFDLAHELGHLLLTLPASFTDKEVESAAHRFAGAFLIPEAAARRELGDKRANISMVELYELKMKYGVSMQAWVCRARDLSIISRTMCDLLFRDFSRRGWRKCEPFDQYPRERTTRFGRLVARAYAGNKITLSRAADLLGVSVEDCQGYLAGDKEIDRERFQQTMAIGS